MSTEEEKKRQDRMNKLIADIESRDERKVIAGLKRVPHEGGKEIIKPMLAVWAKEPGSDVQLLLEKTLFNLKDPEALAPLIEALNENEFRPMRGTILACIWQSGLDASSEIGLLVDIAITEDYMTAVEALTVVGNLENFSDEHLSLNIKKLDKAIEKKTDKTPLLGNLRQVLLSKLLD